MLHVSIWSLLISNLFSCPFLFDLLVGNGCILVCYWVQTDCFRLLACKLWHLLLGFCSQVGLIAVNDGIILRNHISRILQRHFKGKPYYVDLIDLFNEVILSSDISIGSCKTYWILLNNDWLSFYICRLSSRLLQGSCWILSLLMRVKRT